MRSVLTRGTLLTSIVLAGAVVASDWPRFRGPNGSGVAEDKVPTEWGDSKNLKWKTPLPGPGSSSPIVVEDRIFVTCYSGYGGGGGNDPKNLKRHLLCIGRKDGKVLWTKTIDPVLPEDRYGGMGLPEHGYASNTPVADREHVYAFFGKSGVFAFDFEGKELWHVSVGKESDSMRWGSASSLVLYKDKVIVTASSEGRTLFALNKKTGKEEWKAKADGFDLIYGTPALADVEGGKRQELVIAAPGEVWGFNPDTGKLLWYAEIDAGGNISPSVTVVDGIVYATGGIRGRGTAAVRAGGKDDVSKTHVVWKSQYSSYVPSPLVYQGHVYWVSDQGIAFCLDAKNGKLVYQERLPLRGGGGGRGGRSFYASVIVAGDRIYAVSRRDGTFVLAPGATFKQLGQNKLSDDSDFNATPAISNGQILLRSNKALYCIGE